MGAGTLIKYVLTSLPPPFASPYQPLPSLPPRLIVSYSRLRSVFQLVLLLPRLGLWFLSLALRFLRFVLFLVAQLHSLLMAAVGVVIGLSEGLRGVLLGVGVEYR